MVTMNTVAVDVMTISLTINCCILTFSVVPLLRVHALKSERFRRWRTLTKICRHFSERPLQLAKIITEQLLVWTLVLLSLIAICITDVIRYPFRTGDVTSWTVAFIQALFAMNIGRYVFTIVQRAFQSRHLLTVQYRAELVHHLVTLLCYILFLAYRQNMLLGLVGIMMESTSVFDEIGRYQKERDRRNSHNYRRLVVVGCAGTICFRGVVPITFLVIAMFGQTPFAMDYAPLSVFFLAIIFFSVVNVWQILTNIQRFIKHVYDKSNEPYQPTRLETGNISGHVGSSQPRTKRLELAKNNLGYLRPYENKNIANNLDDEKHNLNNKKEFSKETAELMDPVIRFSFVKSICDKPEDLSSSLFLQDLRDSSSSSISQTFEPLRVSSGSSDTNSSSVVAMPTDNLTMVLNNNVQLLMHPLPQTEMTSVDDTCVPSSTADET